MPTYRQVKSGAAEIIAVSTGNSQQIQFNSDPEVEIDGSAGYIQKIPANTMKNGDIYRFTLNIVVSTSSVAFSQFSLRFYNDYQLNGNALAGISATIAGNEGNPPLGSANGIRVVAEMQVGSIDINGFATVKTSMWYVNRGNPSAGSPTAQLSIMDGQQTINTTMDQVFSFAAELPNDISPNYLQAVLMMMERLRK